jgi:hypothetical protein
VFDGDERDQGTNPGSGLSVPSSAITCGGVSQIAAAKLKVTKNLDPSGDEGLTLSGEWVVEPLSPAPDPRANGMRFRINDRFGQPLYNRVLPRAAPIANGAPGWTVNKAGTKWTYRDRRGAVAGGVVRATIQQKSQPGVYGFSVGGKAANFQIDPAALPLELIVVLGGLDEAAAGQCASIAFNDATGPSPACTLSSSGTTIRCK